MRLASAEQIVGRKRLIQRREDGLGPLFLTADNPLIKGRCLPDLWLTDLSHFVLWLRGENIHVRSSLLHYPESWSFHLKCYKNKRKTPQAQGSCEKVMNTNIQKALSSGNNKNMNLHL